MTLIVLGVLGPSGSGVVMVTAYPSTGCVMERMTVWIGVMRKIVLQKMWLVSYLTSQQLALGLTTGGYILI